MPEPVGPNGEKLDTSEFFGMIKGELYRYTDPYISKVARVESAKIRRINKEDDDDKRLAMVRDFLNLPADIDINVVPPFWAEYAS